MDYLQSVKVGIVVPKDVTFWKSEKKKEKKNKRLYLHVVTEIYHAALSLTVLGNFNGIFEPSYLGSRRTHNLAR